MWVHTCVSCPVVQAYVMITNNISMLESRHSIQIARMQTLSQAEQPGVEGSQIALSPLTQSPSFPLAWHSPVSAML